MFPTAENSDYPVFVADQVLTSDNLNDLFGYLDEQGRMTRTNLIGMGIVCGMEVKTAGDGSSITITKGVGVTSFGYLVTVPEIVYTKRTTDIYDAVEPEYYNKFVDIATKTQKFNLWELKQDAESQGTTPLTNAFLQDGDKIVLIFVELLDENNKNCDPNSCDDKGIKVTVNFRPLLAAKSDVDTFLSNSSNSGSVTGNAVSLPARKMPRYDVPSSLLLDTEDVFRVYLNILNQNFIDSVQAGLSTAYSKLQSLLVNDYPDDPFNPADQTLTLHSLFSFLFDNTISDVQTLNLQYYYDFFSDLLLAYDELRKKAYDAVCECLPDENLFPRHLLLGEAIGFNVLTSNYRTRFISSPVLCCCEGDASGIKILFKRLVLMIQNFSIPVPSVKKKFPIKITPSWLGREPLSEKAIPFYYEVNTGADPLYLSWSPERMQQNTANQILSYRARDYNNTDDFVMNPLSYDLEPDNFLRIEGHIGRDYTAVLSNLESQKLSNRLPFEVVALGTDTRGIFAILNALSTMDTTGSVAAAFELIKEHPCCFADILLVLDDWIARVRCCLAEQMRYYIALPAFEANLVPPKENMIRTKAFGTDSNFLVKENTIGQSYELKKEAGTINNQFCTSVFVNIAAGKAQPGSALVMMPYRIDRFSEILPGHITDLDANEMEVRYNDLVGTAAQMRDLYASANILGTLGDMDLTRLLGKLDVNCLICLFSELRLLIREFLIRLLALLIRQKLGYYAYINPGIQHKAGVTMGGTFIIVYHEEPVKVKPLPGADGPASLPGLGHVITKTGASFGSIFSGNQSLLSSILLTEEIDFLQQVVAAGDPADQVLDPIVEGIRPGTVVADFYVPYLCCSECAPASYIFTGPKADELKVTSTDPECDQNGSEFIVTLTISGGKQPYKIDGTAITGDSGLVALPSGQGKTVTVEDSSGLSTDFVITPHTCTQIIDATQSAPKCDAEGKTFSVMLTITGGTPPYTVNGQPINGNTVPVTITSGSGQDVTIVDSLGNQGLVQIPAHVCDQPCLLPCGGLAERCKYVLWIQKPDLNSKISHKTRKATITLTDTGVPNPTMDVISIFAGIIDGDQSIDITNFDTIFLKLFDQLDAQIPAHFKSPNAPMFSYDTDNQLLNIERFKCHDVVMELEIVLNKIDLILNIRYDSSIGVTIDYANVNKPTSVPKFGCIQIKKCEGTSEPDCDKPLIVKDIKVKRDTGATTYSFTATPATGFAAYYWYFPDGRPNSSSKKTPTGIQVLNKAQNVRVYVTDKNGCFGVFEKFLKLP